MTKLRDTVWLWGQTPGSHHINEAYHLPGVNTMTPAEGCDFFGIKNMCRVAMTMGPFPPFDEESAVLDRFDRVIWSVVGAGGVRRNEENFGDLDEILRQAALHKNVIGGIMDDFLLTDRRRELFTPERLRYAKARLRAEAGRPLEYWTVYYERELSLEVQDYLDVFDTITFWNWFAESLADLDRNLDHIYQANPGKKFLCGCYLWDYGNGKALTPAEMEHQLNVYYRHLKAGKLSGIIICSNCIADIGLATVPLLQEWLTAHGDEEI